MSITYALLGFLSWRPHTGYELKKLLSDSLAFYWTGNNAQIYRSLLELHRGGLVSQEVRVQEKYPPRKVYTITDRGKAALHEWVATAPELPQLRNSFVVQLAWADSLDAAAMEKLLSAYEQEVEAQVLMRREMQRRGTVAPARSARETFIWKMIEENGIGAYESELAWVRRLRSDMPARGRGGKK